MKNGFTIIELIISIFVLTMGVVGVFSAFSIVAILTSDSADRLVASYLAQEGMEIVRNIRDTNWLEIDRCLEEKCSVPTWVDGIATLGACTNPAVGCKGDYTTSNELLACGGNETDYLKIDSSVNGTGFYNYTSGTNTKFKRKIKIVEVPDVDGITNPYHIINVTVEVSWDSKATILRGGLKAGDLVNPADSSSKCNPANCVTAEETLFNWY